MIYFALILIIWIGGILSCYLPSETQVNWKLQYFMLISIIIILVGGLRYEVGSDWGSYAQIFTDKLPEDSGGIEPGYVFMNRVFSFLNLPYAFFLCVLFTISYSLKAYSYGKYGSNIFISLLVYIPIQFIVYDINAMRQGLAIAILLLTLPYVLNRKFIPFIIICLIAASIHVTALIFIPFFWFSRVRYSDRKIICLTIVFMGIAILSNTILNSILPLMGVNFVLFEKFLSYSANENYNKVLSFNLSTIYRILILLIFIFMRNRMKIKEEIYLLLRNGYFLSLVIYFTFFSIELIATRGSLYFRIFDTFIFTFVITSFKDIYMKQLLLFLLVVYVSLQVYVSLNMEDNSLLPYHNILFQW